MNQVDLKNFYERRWNPLSKNSFVLGPNVSSTKKYKFNKLLKH